MQEVGRHLHAGNEKVIEFERAERTWALTLQRRQEDYNRWLQNAQNVAGESLSKARTAFRSETINRLTSKLKAQYGADFQSYLLQSAIYDTDRWCAGRETSERNPNERKSVRAFLKKNSHSYNDSDKLVKKHKEHDVR